MVVFWVLCNREIYSLAIQSGKTDEMAVTPRRISFSGAEIIEPLWNSSHLNFRVSSTLFVRKTNLAFLEVGKHSTATSSQILVCVYKVSVTSSMWFVKLGTMLQWATRLSLQTKVLLNLACLFLRLRKDYSHCPTHWEKNINIYSILVSQYTKFIFQSQKQCDH